jgi:hypothetical protein
MYLCLENGGYPGDAQNLYQYKAKSHSLQIYSISPWMRVSGCLDTRGPPGHYPKFIKAGRILLSKKCGLVTVLTLKAACGAKRKITNFQGSTI